MIHVDFIQTHNNKHLERVDGTNRNQCFDLVVAYAMDVYGLPQNIFAGNLFAYEIWDKPTPLASQNFDFIKNTPYAVPKQGDILVFSKAINGTAGHVVVVDSADTNTIKAFSQNDPINSPCIMKNYPYNFVLGWLRKITKSASSDELQACLTAHREAVNSATEWERKYKTEQEIHNKAVEEYKRIIQSHLADKKMIRQKTLEEVKQSIDKLEQT